MAAKDGRSAGATKETSANATAKEEIRNNPVH